MRIRATAIALALALPLLLSVEARAQSPDTTGPHIDLDFLSKGAPGWLPTEATGDATSGVAAAERIIWPIMYIHWQPAAEVKALKPEKAKEAIAALWEGLTIDSPIDVKPVRINAHDGFVADTTIERGAMKTRYHVWLCPESGRLFVTDASMSLMVNAPAEIFGWMNDMVRTVRCHKGAAVETFPALPRTYEVPNGDIAYAHPETWRPLVGFRVVKRWDDWNMRVDNSEAVTPQRGRDVILSMDPLKRIEVFWEPAKDEPMTWDSVNKRMEDYWKERASDLIIQTRGAKGDVWYVDGMVRNVVGDTAMPPHRMHKWKLWAFRREGTDYLVAARMGGVVLGPRRPGLEFNEVELTFDQMLQAVRF